MIVSQIHSCRGLSVEEDRLYEHLLRDELRIANSYIASKRKPLPTLLNEEYPHVLTMDGGVHMFRRSELLYAKAELGGESEKLMLPIYVELLPSQTTTTAVVRDEVAAKLLARILSVECSTPLYLYPVQLMELRRRIKTLIQYVVSPEVLKDVGED